jgi:hypothetical protein
MNTKNTKEQSEESVLKDMYAELVEQVKSQQVENSDTIESDFTFEAFKKWCYSSDFKSRYEYWVSNSYSDDTKPHIDYSDS